MLPNKRLKLAGGDRLKGSGVLCPWRGTDCRPTPLRQRGGRPQLKRDPLGGALPPQRHLLVNSFGTVNTRGAELGCSQTSPGSPRPTPHGRAYRNAAPRPSFRWLVPHRQVLNPKAGAASEPHAARSSLGAKRAV